MIHEEQGDWNPEKDHDEHCGWKPSNQDTDASSESNEDYGGTGQEEDEAVHNVNPVESLICRYRVT